jgi:hypothetical protein
VNPDTDPNYENRLNEKIEELMKKGGGYYPFEHSNFSEVMATLADEQTDRLADLCSNSMLSNAGAFLVSDASNYWERLARTEAEARLEEEYDSCECGGVGCSDCENNENEGE